MRYHAHNHTSGAGHVYQGRFKSFPVQDDEHFHSVYRYVERNALRAKLVRRAENWRWGSLWRWLQKPEPDPELLYVWPIARLPRWVDRVNQSLGDAELNSIRNSVQRGCPLGDELRVKSTVKKFGLQSTLRPRGRPRINPLDETQNNES